MKNKLFPKWVTANIIIPKIISGNISVTVIQDSYDRSAISVDIIDNLSENITLVPIEDRSYFLETLNKIIWETLQSIGFNPGIYKYEMIDDRMLYRIKYDVENCIFRFEEMKGIKFEDLLMEKLGVPNRPSGDIVTTLIKF